MSNRVSDCGPGAVIVYRMCRESRCCCYATDLAVVLRTFCPPERSTQADSAGEPQPPMPQQQEQGLSASGASISKRAQMQTLRLLIRRDPRVLLYLVVLTAVGAVIVPMSYFFMSLSDICHTQHTCDFSK